MENLVWKVGDVRITRIPEQVVSLPAFHLIPEATAEGLAPHEAWLAPHFLDAPDDQGRPNFLLSIHGLVVESKGHTVLVDTCTGEKAAPGFEALLVGDLRFLDHLRAAGFDPDRIDTVLCTHLHFDHVGMNTRRDGDRWVPTFPNARYLFARAEWEHWTQGGDPAYVPTLSEAVQPIVDAGLADLVDSDHRITDEVRLEATPGHTPGHVAVRIESGGEQALITGDLTHHPVQWAEPEWTMRADTDGAQAVRTRYRLLGEHTDAGTLVIGTHYAPPCAGRLVKQDGGVKFDVGG